MSYNPFPTNIEIVMLWPSDVPEKPELDPRRRPLDEEGPAAEAELLKTVDHASAWISWPTEAQIEQHDGLWMYRMDGYPKSLEVGSFELVDRPGDEPFWEWSNGSHKVTSNSTACPLVMFAPVDSEGRLGVRLGARSVRLDTT